MVENKIVKSVRKFAEPTEKWLKARIRTNKKQPLSKVAFHLSEMGLVLNLLHAHRVSHLWHCHSMLNLFAIRTRFAPSVRKFAEPTEKWLKAYIRTNKKQPLSKVAFHLSEMGLEPTRKIHTHLKRTCLPFHHSDIFVVFFKV